MVRLKEAECHYTVTIVNHFNSSMVRLKVIVAQSKHETAINFNSSMVRLKDFFTRLLLALPQISIPQWCD